MDEDKISLREKIINKVTIWMSLYRVTEFFGMWKVEKRRTIFHPWRILHLFKTRGEAVKGIEQHKDIKPEYYR